MTLRSLLMCVLLSRLGLGAAEPVALSGRTMGTSWSAKYIPLAASPARELVERAIVERLEQLEQLFSTYRPQSQLSLFNAVARTDWVPVTTEMVRVASESRKISELTGGAFDVTVDPLVRLWGFGGKGRSGSIPSTREITMARERVDWRRLDVRLEPPALRKGRPEITVDFSSMAKGFAADAISELLSRRGMDDHLVQVGGDVKASGSSAAGLGWRAAVEQPLDEASAIACVIVLNGQALSTSGDYRNFLQVGQQRYGHIIDPRNGRPPSGPLASVSVIHASCAWSSALATALFVLGEEEGYRLATKQGLACLFQSRHGPDVKRRATPAFERMTRPYPHGPDAGPRKNERE